MKTAFHIFALLLIHHSDASDVTGSGQQSTNFSQKIFSIKSSTPTLDPSSELILVSSSKKTNFTYSTVSSQEQLFTAAGKVDNSTRLIHHSVCKAKLSWPDKFQILILDEYPALI